MTGLCADKIDLALGGRPILHALDLALGRGVITAILGPNGAGKSTLLDCLAGLRRPDAGAVRLGGADLAAMKSRKRARAIGYLPQNAEIAWAIDVETLVGLGRFPHHGPFGMDQSDRDSVARALAECDLSAFASRKVSTLSGGERMRALIARVLAGDPDWLLADEPLTGLDPGHKLDVAHLLRDLSRQGMGIVLTLHDLDFALRYADRCVILLEGRILKDAAAAAALTPETIAAAYGVSARLLEGQAGSVIEILEKDRA